MEESSEAENWRTVWSFESQELLSLAAVHALEAAGIAVPRKPPDCWSSSSSSSCFRVPLCVHQETLPYQSREGPILHLPRVFVETVQFLERNVDCEGLFRKTGSVTRQKALRATLEAGSSLPPSTIVNDVASLLKQYLRELPEPLIPSHLTPVFESCHSRPERQRCLLTACLLLPPVHLQCLCVLFQLLSSVAGREDSSLMDAGSLAVVMAPNLLRSTHTSLTLPYLDGSLKVHTAVVKELIESCDLIGRVPPDVAEHAQRVVANPEESCDGVMGEGELPTRMRKKSKKQRSSSISGLVLGLGNRLKSIGGHLPSTPTHAHPHTPTSSPSTEGGVAPCHMTQLGKVPSFKRRGNSCEDLTESNACKRPALLPPHPHTPLNNNHKKRRSLLTRRRHTDHRKHAHKPSFFSLPHAQQLFRPSVGTVKIDLASQPTGINRSPEWKGGEGEGVQLVGFASLQSPQMIAVTSHRTRRKEVMFAGLPDNEASVDAISQPAVVDVALRLNCECPPDIREQVAEFEATVASREIEFLCPSDKETHTHKTRALPVEPRSNAYHSRLLLQSRSMFPLPTPPHTTSSAAYKAKKSSAKRRRYEANSGDTMGVSSYASELEWAKPAQSASGPAFRLESQPGFASTSEDANRKGNRAEVELPSTDASAKPDISRQDASVPAVFVPGTRSGLPSSSSAEQLYPTPAPFIFQGTLGVRASKSDYHLKVPQFNFVDHDAVFRFTKNSPVFGGPAKIPTSHSHPFLPHFSTRPGSEDPKKADATPTTLKAPYTFSNPTPVHTKSEQSASDSVEMSARDCEEMEEFESSRKTAECKEATLLDEFDLQPGSNNTMEMDSLEESSESLMGAIPSASTPLRKLDEGFLKTPLPFHSPNLLEKISLEIAARHQFSPSTPLLPEGALKINDSYKQAVLGENYLLPIAGPTALKFDASFSDTSDISLNKTTDKGPGIAVLQNQSRGVMEGGATTGEEVETGTDSCKTTVSRDIPTTAHPVQSLKPPTPELRTRIGHKAHHKLERSGVCWQATPTPSTPHHFTFSLPSPWSRGRGGGEGARISKRAQVYMVSMPTGSPSHLPPTPPHKPHIHKGVRRHHSQRVANKENASDSVRGGGGKVGPGHMTHRAIQVKEWIV